jgi:phosphoenolpyruvate carboxylase
MSGTSTSTSEKPLVEEKPLIEEGLKSIDDLVGFMQDCLRDVLTGLGEHEAANHLDDIQSVPPAQTGQRYDRLAQVDSIWFQLLNMIEEHVAGRVRRRREADRGLAAEPGLWGEVLQDLAKADLDPELVRQALRHVRVEPVLTAHPTEAKPSTVIEQHRAIYDLLGSSKLDTGSRRDRDAAREEIKASLERLWRTGEILLQKPDLHAERANLLYYLREVFPGAVQDVDERLRQAWAAAGHGDLGDDPDDLPDVTFGFWAGGDRDGHPGVTHEVTKQTLGELREAALKVHRRALASLSDRMSLSGHVQEPSEALSNRITALAKMHRLVYADMNARHPNEPWRHLVLLMLAHLPASRSGGPSYHRPSDYEADLRLLHQSLVDVGAERLAKADVLPVLRHCKVLGFHLAKLDVRQNSDYHDRAFSQLLKAAGVPDADSWADWPEDRRLDLLNHELGGPRPFARFGRKIGAECDELLATYRVITEEMAAHGVGGLGSLIVSMTKRLSDLLVVYVFAREAGLARFDVDAEQGGGQLVCPLPVVPLFETQDDLEAAPGLMEDFLAHQVTVASMKSRPGRVPSLLTSREETLPVQQVMLGYSDSNKTSGILAAQFALHRCQEQLGDVADHQNVRLRFFHGRGGTISRGAGPTHRFLESLPQRSLGGDVRLTEQGETVAQKFANADTAAYHMELLVAGVAGVTLQNRVQHGSRKPPPHDLLPAAEKLAASSADAYKQLVASEGFIQFFRSATPIDALEQSNIGSRPSRRTGRQTLDDLRAIPWVFGWNQARFYLPGWFGVGSALRTLQQNDADWFERIADPETGVSSYPFLNYLLTNVETNIASADEDLMREYADLVPDEANRDRMLGRIMDEFDRTAAMLNLVFGGRRLKERRPRMVKTLRLREARLRVLHHRQIELLRRWRPLKAAEDEAAHALLPQLLLSVNAIASGLRTTG